MLYKIYVTKMGQSKAKNTIADLKENPQYYQLFSNLNTNEVIDQYDVLHLDGISAEVFVEELEVGKCGAVTFVLVHPTGNNLTFFI